MRRKREKPNEKLRFSFEAFATLEIFNLNKDAPFLLKLFQQHHFQRVQIAWGERSHPLVTVVRAFVRACVSVG